MASSFSTCWIYLWIIVLARKLSAVASPPHYIIRHTKVSFDQAMRSCSPGVLTTLATEQEVAKILGLISKVVSPQTEFTFWVGLKKAKNKCVVPTLPLRGFQWMEDGSEESQVSRWLKDPQDTCVSVRCAALQGEFDGSTVTRWGLIPVNCKDTTVHQFICKLRDSQTRLTSEDRVTTVNPVTLEPMTPKLAAPEPSKPIKPEPKPATPEPHRPTKPEPKTGTPEPAKPESKTVSPEQTEPVKPEDKLPVQGRGQENDQTFQIETEQLGPDPGPGPGMESDACQNPVITGARFLRPDPDNSSRIQVECWSTVQLELHCRGRPAMWYLLNDSPANFTTICQPCSDGFSKDTSGICEDIDECSGGPCRHTCLNTEGSYRCVCSDEDGMHHDEDSPVCMVTIDDSGSLSGILIPVLVAVAVLVVLVVVVAVTVKCCLMRRSKKHAMKKKENMAMKNKDSQDSFATDNEKTVT